MAGSVVKVIGIGGAGINAVNRMIMRLCARGSLTVPALLSFSSPE